MIRRLASASLARCWRTNSSRLGPPEPWKYGPSQSFHSASGVACCHVHKKSKSSAVTALSVTFTRSWCLRRVRRRKGTSALRQHEPNDHAHPHARTELHVEPELDRILNRTNVRDLGLSPRRSGPEGPRHSFAAAGALHLANPPSVLSTCPVIQRPSSLTSHSISRAGSSGFPIRPKGNIDATVSASSCAM